MRDTILWALITLLAVSVAQARTLEEYIEEAKTFQALDSLKQATAAMLEAVAAFPDESIAHTYLGLYLGMQAGAANNFIEAGQLATRSFETLDRAVSLEANNARARLYRGLMGVHVPEFLGKLDRGIEDLEFVIAIHAESPERVPEDLLVEAYDYLGMGWEKKGRAGKAREAWQKVIELAPGSELAKRAAGHIEGLSPSTPVTGRGARETDTPQAAAGQSRASQEERADVARLLAIGRSHVDAGEFEEADSVLKRAIALEPANLPAHMLRLRALGGLAAKGYDKAIAKDTNLRMNLAFEVMNVADKAVSLAPDDMELLLMKGILGVQLPFFVGKLDQAIGDLSRVRDSHAPEAVKAQALYWLGVALEKKAMTGWIEVVTKHPKTEASRMVLDRIKPSVSRLDLARHPAPLVAIDFILGFQDELPPQTAVWIEDSQGRFVKTIYVSGFSGYAKDTQITLPAWAASTEFAGVEGVTGASIDRGHYIYVWDLDSAQGTRMGPGEYQIKVEVAYWPSRQYQLVAAAIPVGGEKEKTVIREGDLIPYLEVAYFPEGDE